MRKKKSFRNFVTSFFPYLIVLILGFVKIDVFLSTLGEEIYALNQLFFQLFAYISLAEAGACTYIIQLYYKHFVNGDKEKIKETYQGSKRFLTKVAIAVLIIGSIVSFSLGFLTNNHLSLVYMQIVFMLFILRSVIEYLMMSPKLVMQADQKLYKINIVYYIFKIAELVFEIGLLLMGFDYIITLLSSMLLRYLTYVFINKRVFKEYPWLRDKIAKTDVKIKGVNNMFIHRIAEAVHYNTDIILTSSFLSPFLVTIYSSYNYITKYLTDGIDLIGNSISSSVGNVVYKENREENKRILDELLVIYLVFATFLSVVTYIMINSFINLWIGEKYIFSTAALILLILNFFIVIARKPLNIYFYSAGWFKETRLIVCLEAVVNLVLSILLVFKYGIVGILFATTISMLTTTFWYIPKFVLKDNLNMSLIKYFGRFILAIILAASLCFIGSHIINHLSINSFITWGLLALLVSIIVLVLLASIYYIFSKPFRRIFHKILDTLKIKKNNKGVQQNEI